MRRLPLILPVLVLAGCGAQAAAQPAPSPVTALTRLDDSGTFALAGDGVLFTRTRGRVLEVRRVDSAEPLYRFEAPEGAVPSARLAASAERTGLIVTTEDDTSYMASVQELIDLEPLGPPFKPAREAYFPGFHQIEGARVITDEFRGDFRRVRWIVREPGAEPRVVELPRQAVVASFAGDLVAYLTPFPGQEDDEPQRLTVQDWRTGQPRYTVRIRDGIEDFDLRADGRAVLNQDGGGVHEVSAAGAVERHTRTGVAPQWAGDRIVFLRLAEREGDERLMLVEPDGRVRRFGVPTAEVKGFVTDASRVLWSANGCLLLADASAPAASAPGEGPCPRSELFLDRGEGSVMRRDGRVPVSIRCVAAAPPGCVGTVRIDLADRSPRGRDSTTVRFRIPAGRVHRLAPRLTRSARRAAARDGAAVVTAVAVDPAGRRSVLSDGYWIETRR